MNGERLSVRGSRFSLTVHRTPLTCVDFLAYILVICYLAIFV